MSASSSIPMPDPALEPTRARVVTYVRLPETHLARLGITDIHAPIPAVRVPYFSLNGTEVAARLFISLTDPPSNRWIGKSRPRLYGLERLADARTTGRMALALGEPSSWILSYHAEPALALPSPDVWDDDRYGPMLAAIPHIDLVITDSDRDALLERFSRSQLRRQIRIIDLATDSIVDLHHSDPNTFPERWTALRQNSQTRDDLERIDSDHGRTEAYESVKDLLHDPSILDRLREAFMTLGWAGDPSFSPGQFERNGSAGYRRCWTAVDDHSVQQDWSSHADPP